MDIVYIRDLRMDAVIGVYEWERRINQEINVNIEMGWDNRQAAETDDLQYGLSYKEAANLVKEFVAESSYELVETLAEKIAELLLEKMAVNWIKVTVGKPFAVSDSAEVGVSIERYRQEKNIKVFIDIGSNINREVNIQSCVDQLRADFPGIIFSKAYESETLGFEGDPFINITAGFETDLSYPDLKFHLKNIENKHARERIRATKFISRTLDVDVILYGNQVLQPEYDVPRSEILKYPFVLFPLAEIAPDIIHPQQKMSISDLAKATELKRTTLKEIPDFPVYKPL
jgi:2-amino-4-hydroxy-6-hydroxymethyldihydropteridine diphosphokinase